MSVENLKEYARRCASEPELLEAAREFGLTDMGEHIKQAKTLGLEWGMDDMVDFRKEMVEEEGDLSEKELEQIAGGVVTAVAAVVAVGAAVGVGAGAVVGGAVGGSAAASGDGGW